MNSQRPENNDVKLMKIFVLAKQLRAKELDE